MFEGVAIAFGSRGHQENGTAPPRNFENIERSDRTDLQRLNSMLSVVHRTRRRCQMKDVVRSEEHTSELQSHLNLVCRLLLEKKKKKQKPENIMIDKKKHDTGV